MYPQHFHACANVVILSLLHVPATRLCYMSPRCVLHKIFVAAACCCDMSLQQDPSCLPTLTKRKQGQKIMTPRDLSVAVSISFHCSDTSNSKIERRNHNGSAYATARRTPAKFFLFFIFYFFCFHQNFFFFNFILFLFTHTRQIKFAVGGEKKK